MMHTMKMEICQQLDLIILQSISDKERIGLASLALMNKYNLIPYVPSAEVEV